MSASTLNGNTAAPGLTLCMSREEVTSSLFMLEPFGAHKARAALSKHKPSASASLSFHFGHARTDGKVKNQTRPIRARVGVASAFLITLSAQLVQAEEEFQIVGRRGLNSPHFARESCCLYIRNKVCISKKRVLYLCIYYYFF